MAFGKKKDEAVAVDASADDENGALFPIEPGEDGGAAEAPAPEAVAEAPVAEAAAEAAPAEAAAGTDALLSMFQEAEAASDDRSVVLDLAGEVELADLLEDLQTLKAAMGIVAA